MRVFLTGGTGFIGSAILSELVVAGYHVVALARSETAAKTLEAAGAEVHRGSLEQQESLRRGAKNSDGVIHCAFDHDFSRFQENSLVDKHAIETLGKELAGSDRPLIVSIGLGLPSPVRPVTEVIDEPAVSPYPRVSEQTARALSEQGVSTAVVRLPQVHDTVKQGLVTRLIAVAREKGVSAYVAEGQNRWPAAHVLDVAHLYRLALEKHEPGARYHAVAEEGISLRDIAEAIGRGLNVPVVSIPPDEAGDHFGVAGRFAGTDLSASSAITRQRLGWHPTGPGLIEDLRNMRYHGK